MAFGVASRDAGLSLLDTIGFSVFVFTGSAQVVVIGAAATALFRLVT